MAAAGWTSPTGVWLPVAGVENGATKFLSFSVVNNIRPQCHSRWRVLQARTRPLWRRVPVGLRPQRRRKHTGTAASGGS